MNCSLDKNDLPDVSLIRKSNLIKSVNNFSNDYFKLSVSKQRNENKCENNYENIEITNLKNKIKVELNQVTGHIKDQIEKNTINISESDLLLKNINYKLDKFNYINKFDSSPKSLNDKFCKGIVKTWMDVDATQKLNLNKSFDLHTHCTKHKMMKSNKFNANKMKL